jgi:type I restriction enzyme R subunit
MSNIEKSASERTFQENYVNELKKYKWQAPDYLNGNKQKVTVNDLVNNWRKELNRINADQLEGEELTDNEFNQVLTKVKQINNSYEAAKLLAMEESIGKIDGIYRDDNPRITRKQITLTIFKKAEVSGGDSSYNIAREIQTENGNRFDIVLLINGLPLINIEQKRADKSLEEAYNQFKRYYRDGEYQNNFMAFSQMMVITSEVATQYFATPKSLDAFNPVFLFHWADIDNNPVNDWQKVIEKFLMIPMAHQMVGDYLVIDEEENSEDQKHMLMRPYQVYALQAVEGAAFGWDNDAKNPHGGFVWHTTGSGKTITSFKTALFLSTRAGFDKVVFLVDRKELDTKTSENFKAYSEYEPVTVDNTKHTYQLKNSFKKRGIVVTTIFKLNSLVKELVENGDNKLKEKKIVFILDEAHRTTMSTMMANITEYFKENGLFYGFTGTPLFDENLINGKINRNSEVINTTEKLFGPCLHKYTIDSAISDGNVLGFHVDYINTGEFSSYDSLRDELAQRIKIEHPEKSEREIEKSLYQKEDLAIEKMARDKEILIYQDETHIPRVVTDIIENWDSQSQQKQFNAILTVAYKKRVIQYYKEFKKQLANSSFKINIAITFSSDNENDNEKISSDIIDEMFSDYESFTGVKYSSNVQDSEEAYFEDLVMRSTRGGSGRNEKNIDLIIVADRLLTGYDSKRLNTLYVDRFLELHGLIQAYSRTNRIFGETKEFGTIINYKFPRITKEAVNTALQLYGSGGKNSRVIVDEYKVATLKLYNLVLSLISSLPEPTKWQTIKDDQVKKEEFNKCYREARSQLNTVGQYYEFVWDDKEFGLSEHKWLQYTGAYRNLNQHDVTPIDSPKSPKPLIGKTRLGGSDIIDAGYIIRLIGSKVTKNNQFMNIDSESLRIVYEQIQEMSDLGNDQRAQLIKRFVDEELLKGKIPSNISFDDAFEKWKRNESLHEISIFAQEWGINNIDLLEKTIQQYSFNYPDVIPNIDEIIMSADIDNAINKEAGNLLQHRIKLSEALNTWVVQMKSDLQ